jgi:hypothetical protein
MRVTVPSEAGNPHGSPATVVAASSSTVSCGRPQEKEACPACLVARGTHSAPEDRPTLSAVAGAGDRRRYRVLLTHASGELADGYWETDEPLEELPAVGTILYVRSHAQKDRQVRARVYHTDAESVLPIAAIEAPRG